MKKTKKHIDLGEVPQWVMALASDSLSLVLRDPHDERNRPTSFPLISTHVLWCVHRDMHTQTINNCH